MKQDQLADLVEKINTSKAPSLQSLNRAYMENRLILTKHPAPDSQVPAHHLIKVWKRRLARHKMETKDELTENLVKDINFLLNHLQQPTCTECRTWIIHEFPAWTYWVYVSSDQSKVLGCVRLENKFP